MAASGIGAFHRGGDHETRMANSFGVSNVEGGRLTSIFDLDCGN